MNLFLDVQSPSGGRRCNGFRPNGTVLHRYGVVTLKTGFEASSTLRVKRHGQSRVYPCSNSTSGRAVPVVSEECA